MKKLFLILTFIVATMTAGAQSFIDATDAEVRRYFIWQNTVNRNAATADSILGFVSNNDTVYKIPLSALAGFWSLVGYQLYVTDINDSVAIGKTSANHKLDVNGRMAAAFDTTNRAYFLCADSSGSVISLIDTNRFSGGGVSYWTRSNDSLFPATPTDNVFLLDSVYFTGLPYKDCDTMLGISNDTIFQMEAPSGGSTYWEISGDSLKNIGTAGYDYLFFTTDVFSDRYSHSATNTLFGVGVAGAGNLTGTNNILLGYNAGNGLTSGVGNVFIGGSAGEAMTTQSSCVFIGTSAGKLNTASNNIFIGDACGDKNTSGSNNMALGSRSFTNNVTGGSNIAMGYDAGYGNTGSNNTYVGYGAGRGNTTGGYNTVIGSEAGASGYGGNVFTGNVLVGRTAGMLYSGANYNVALGYEANKNNVTADYGVAIGMRSGYACNGDRFAFIGAYSGIDETGSNTIIIDVIDRTSEALGRSGALFYAVANATPASNITAIGGGGNVGIGTISPQTKLHLHDESGSLGAILYMYHTTAGNYPQVNFAKFNGTSSSYAAIADATSMGGINFSGSYSASASRGAAAIRIKSTQLWTATANGCEMNFYTTENDSAAADISMKIDSNANVIVPYGDVVTFGGYSTWAPTLAWTGGTPGAATIVARYQIINRTVHFIITLDGSNDSGSTLTALNVTLPETPKDVNLYPPISCLYNNSGKVSFAGLLGAYVDATDGTAANRKLYTLTFSILNEADYIFTFEGFYEITSK